MNTHFTLLVLSALVDSVALRTRLGEDLLSVIRRHVEYLAS